MWSIFTSIQIFSPVHCYHISTTPAPIFLWAYFNTPAILFNASDSVAVLWLVATLTRINKRKWSLKKRNNRAKLNAIAKDFSFSIQGSPALCQPFFPSKPHTQTFLTLQSKWAPEEELSLNNNLAFRGVEIQQSSEFFELLSFKCLVYSFMWLISKSLSLISIQNSVSITLNLGIFQIIECPTSSRKEFQLYAPPNHTIWEWRTEINKFDLVYRITRHFMKYNLIRFRMRGS